MKANDLYARTPEEVSNKLCALDGFYYNHMPELGDSPKLWDAQEKNTRVEYRVLKEFDFDGRRFWRLATFWLDGEPFMIIQNAGREGDDHARRFITDEARYKEAVAYIKSLLPPEELPINHDVIDPNEDRADLDTFYSNTLDGHFERHYY